MKKEIIIIAILLIKVLVINGQATYDIGNGGVDWELEDGTSVNPNSATNNLPCNTVLIYAQKINVSGGGTAGAGLLYPLANGGASISLTLTGNAQFTGSVFGVHAAYFTWTVTSNSVTGIQNAAIPMILDDPMDDTNGAANEFIKIGIITPNQVGGSYTINYNITHPNQATYNSSTNGDSESTNASNAGNCILPIKIYSFTGINVEGNNILEWETSEEENGSHFEIERSDDAEGGFQKIGEIKVKGEGSKYNYIDQSSGELSYYRLKLVDIDRSYSYSKVIALEGLRNEGLNRIYPNPFTELATIESKENIRRIIVRDISGKVVMEKNIEGKREQIDFRGIKEGVYITEYMNKEGVVQERTKIIKTGN